MKRPMRWITILLAGAMFAAIGASSSEAGWPGRRVTTSFSYPTVPVTTYSPVVMRRGVYAPVVAASPVVVASPYATAPVVATPPVVAASPVVTASPVIAAPVVTTPVIARRHAYFAPAVVAPAPVTTYYAPAYLVP